MRTTRYAVRALALSLSLTAVGAFGVAAASSAPATSAPTTTAPATAGAPHAGVPAGDPVGGAQLSASGVIVNLGPGVPAPPKMPGAAYLIADLDTGQILAARAPHQRHLPASTLKTLTALTLIPRLDANAKIMVEPQDVRVEGTHVGILAGTAYSVRTLFQGLLMSSGNDAAWALARANGSVAMTLAQMNATASDLGAFDTLAKDPSGLDAPGQASSVYDLALIGRAAMKLPDFRAYVATRSASVPGGRSSTGKMLPGFKISTHNKLIYNYKGAIGIKNGYTIAAKQTIVGAATRGGKSYIVTEMASPNGSWRPVAALLDWAFAHGTSVTPIGELVKPGAATTPRLTSAAHGRPVSQMAESPRESPRPPALPRWVGRSGLISGLAVVGALAVVGTRARRKSSRKRS